jgi:hypothetical protein
MCTGTKAIQFAAALGAMLILSLSSGIHDLESHVSIPGAAPSPYSESVSLKPKLNDSAGDHCNACFLNLLLSQALFPILSEPVIADSFEVRVRLFPGTSPIPDLDREVNRGPPSTAALF